MEQIRRGASLRFTPTRAYPGEDLERELRSRDSTLTHAARQIQYLVNSNRFEISAAGKLGRRRILSLFRAASRCARNVYVPAGTGGVAEANIQNGPSPVINR